MMAHVSTKHTRIGLLLALFHRERPGVYCAPCNCVHDSGAVCGELPITQGVLCGLDNLSRFGWAGAVLCGLAGWAAFFALIF